MDAARAATTIRRSNKTSSATNATETARQAIGSTPLYSMPPYKDDMDEHCVTISQDGDAALERVSAGDGVD